MAKAFKKYLWKTYLWFSFSQVPNNLTPTLFFLLIKITSLKFVFLRDRLDKSSWRSPGRTFPYRRDRKRIKFLQEGLLFPEARSFTILTSFWGWTEVILGLVKRIRRLWIVFGLAKICVIRTVAFNSARN